MWKNSRFAEGCVLQHGYKEIFLIPVFNPSGYFKSWQLGLFNSIDVSMLIWAATYPIITQNSHLWHHEIHDTLGDKEHFFFVVEELCITYGQISSSKGGHLCGTGKRSLKWGSRGVNVTNKNIQQAEEKELKRWNYYLCQNPETWRWTLSLGTCQGTVRKQWGKSPWWCHLLTHQFVLYYWPNRPISTHLVSWITRPTRVLQKFLASLGNKGPNSHFVA